ncbi:MAG: GNAT family N-acetyltransferase [Verrucomicrobia bacterium]|nr:GNAT family N-acetyltransferase [Verrucomicrobiota bacterium]
MRPKELSFRVSEPQDTVFLKNWLMDPKILFWFPMEGEKEVDDSIRTWMEYVGKGYGLTALWEGLPCGMATLYIQPFEKLAHTCLFSIIVAPDHRGRGIGTALLEDLMEFAKNTFHIEILHLEVYEGNPAKRLYERLGFTPFGRHASFTKEADGVYRAKICMQKKLSL